MAASDLGHAALSPEAPLRRHRFSSHEKWEISIFRTFSDGFGAFSVDESGQEDCFDEPTEAT